MKKSASPQLAMDVSAVGRIARCNVFTSRVEAVAFETV